MCCLLTPGSGSGSRGGRESRPGFVHRSSTWYEEKGQGQGPHQEQRVDRGEERESQETGDEVSCKASMYNYNYLILQLSYSSLEM